MNPAKSVGTLVLLAGLLLAAGRPAAADATQATPSRTASTAAPADHDAVFQLIPADAWLIAYSADVRKTAENPLLTPAFLPGSSVPAFLAAASKALDGPAMLAVSGTPISPWSWRITIAGRTTLGRDAFFERLATEFVPRFNRSGSADKIGALSFAVDGEYGELTSLGPIPLSVTVALREGLVFGSSGPGLTEAWLQRGSAPDAFADGEEFKRLIAGFQGPVGSMVYLDVRSLIPMLAASSVGIGPNLVMVLLELDNLQSLAVLTARSMRPGDVAVEPSDVWDRLSSLSFDRLESRSHTRDRLGARRPIPPELRLAVGVNTIEAGPWHLIASPADRPAADGSHVSLAKYFPAETTFLIHGSMERASELVEDIFAVAGVIDQAIADEYELERADFKREIGFDPHSDFLANFVGAWAFGGRFERGDLRDLLFAVRIEDVKAFTNRMQTLRSAFQLKITSHDHRRVTVHHADRRSGPFSYAVVDDVLLISSNAQGVAHAIDAATDGRGLSDQKFFAALRDSASPKASKLVYFDLGRALAAEWESEETDDAPPELRALVTSGGAVALTVTPYERMIAVDLITKAKKDGVVTEVLLKIVSASLEQARARSARLRSIASVKNLLISCNIYANDHKHRWPESLTLLVEDGSITAKMLSNPYKPVSDGAPTPYYLYRPVADTSAVSEPAAEVVICEPEVHDGGAVFGFFDGHAEWITSPRAEELLAIMRGR